MWTLTFRSRLPCRELENPILRPKPKARYRLPSGAIRPCCARGISLRIHRLGRPATIPRMPPANPPRPRHLRIARDLLSLVLLRPRPLDHTRDLPQRSDAQTSLPIFAHSQSVDSKPSSARSAVSKVARRRLFLRPQTCARKPGSHPASTKDLDRRKHKSLFPGVPAMRDRRGWLAVQSDVL